MSMVVLPISANANRSAEEMLLTTLSLVFSDLTVMTTSVVAAALSKEQGDTLMPGEAAAMMTAGWLLWPQLAN